MFTIKNIIKIGLLLFVVISISFLVYKETTGNISNVQNNSTNSLVEVSNEKKEGDIKTHKELVKAYYFHGNNRCYTCRVMEGYIQEALSMYFSKEIENGDLVWLVTNAQKPENQHFARDFQLTSISMVLAKTKNGEVQNWKNLDKIWQLVRDKNAFVNYIKMEVDSYLKGN